MAGLELMAGLDLMVAHSPERSCCREQTGWAFGGMRGAACWESGVQGRRVPDPRKSSAASPSVAERFRNKSAKLLNAVIGVGISARNDCKDRRLRFDAAAPARE